MASQYDKIIDMIKKLDLQDDGIRMNHKIKAIEQDFCNIVLDENMLSESMEYINETVLDDGEASLKFALLFSSRNFDSLAMNDTKVRSKMLKLLQYNFQNAEHFRKVDKNRLYNSVTLLGEYYHRVRLADGSPIAILGESLLRLLTQEIAGEDYIDLRLAKLILSQVTLNGAIIRTHHREDLNLLLYHIRRNFIEQPKLTPAVKALLLMTLDLYYSNFSNLGHMLEEMYTKYLVEEDHIETEELSSMSGLNLENGNTSFESMKTGGGVVDVMPMQASKKWSEQVCEDSFYDNENNLNGSNNSYCDNIVENDENVGSDLVGDEGHPNHQKLGPQQQYQNRSPDGKIQQNKPHWRQQRFNRIVDQQESNDRHFANNNNRRNRRFSASNDEDQNSVRSENGSIKLYSVGDRLRHSQTKLDRNNWDQRNNYRSNSRNNYENNNYNNRNTYDRPPRFRNNDKFKNSSGDVSWRNENGQENQYKRGGSHGPESNSRSSSRTRTLPRPPKSNFEGFNGGGNRGRRSQSPDDTRRNSFQNNNHNKSGGSSGVGHFNRNNRPQHSRNFSRSNRYSSQNSLASDTTGTWDRRNNRRNNQRAQSQDWDETRSMHGQPEEATWDAKDNNSELVKNARNTTKYMEYLSQK